MEMISGYNPDTQINSHKTGIYGFLSILLFLKNIANTSNHLPNSILLRQKNSDEGKIYN